MTTQEFDIDKFISKLTSNPVTLFIIAAIFTTFIIGSMCFVYIKPFEFGIKQVNIGLNRGIQQKKYETGLHFVIPFGFEEMHKLPKNTQLFELTNTPLFRQSQSTSAVNIQTSDGFFVSVDVSILYRIQDPLTVIKTVGTGQLYIINGIMPKAEPILKDALGQLTTEEFYNPYLRVEKMHLAQKNLNAELASKGIKIDDVFIRYFRYSSEIQKNIEDKKLKDQLVFKNKSEARAATEAALLAKVVEEGEATLKIELEKGNAYRIKRNAERDLYVRTKKAAANLLVRQAEATKTKLKNIALKGKGSDNMVGLKMAEVFEGLDVVILPSDGKSGINPFNLDSLLNIID
tara:strand:- start:290 stop:1327 length:1038 start_codon:yes stop_codon:yes gene_type:complete